MRCRVCDADEAGPIGPASGGVSRFRRAPLFSEDNRQSAVEAPHMARGYAVKSTSRFSFQALALAAAAFALVGGCSNVAPSPRDFAAGNDRAVGASGGPCFANKTCFSGLRCAPDGRCVPVGAIEGGVVGDSALDRGAPPDVGAGGEDRAVEAGDAADGGGGDRPVAARGDAAEVGGQPGDDGPRRADASLSLEGGACAHACDAGDRRCEADGYRPCVVGGSGCRDWGALISCGPEESCRRSDGECVATCTTPPCECISGTKKLCGDIGECSGGFRQCVDGKYGPCQWTRGPQPESCDGKDNDCDGKADEPEDLVAPLCDKTAGVCAGAVQACGGALGWLPCNDSVYKAHAGAAYQLRETLCDGKDNDCNGKTDEPASCCVPQCDAKACGADDGCGNPCPQGSCSGKQELCVGGHCLCQPNCANQVCGGNDGCGGRCLSGACGSDRTCVVGQCQCSYLDCGGLCCGRGEQCEQGKCVSPATPSWQSLTRFTNKTLYAVWGTAADNVWAGGEGGVLFHFDGLRWSAAHSAVSASIRVIWGVSANDVWAAAVGGHNEAIFIHYDGKNWSEVASPTGNNQALFRSLWGSAANDIWAIGQRYDGGIWRGVIAHYDGAKWSVTMGIDRRVYAVWGSAKGDIWARGDTAYHYDGASWQPFDGVVPPATQYGLWGSAKGDVWSVGSDYNGTGILQRFDGAKWSDYAPPVSATYWAVWGAGPSSVYAVGQYGSILVFNGKGWEISRSATLYTDELQAVWGSSANDVWAVGYEGTVLHFGG